ncbi:MAG: NusB family [Marinobacter excellens HL-55]|uniref:NusB family n=1 Tax=Marinobacter excellens HL-55 TaxID=1305731 RepID=A0A0P7Z0E9_9GAMM|nr:MAG: NusB family [Marinobacter excellens HL-55]
MAMWQCSKLPRLVAVALTAAFIFAGCSSTKMAYRYADWGVVWWVEDFVSLDRDQKRQLNQDLDTLRQWHCSAELPRYSAWLEELEADVASGPLDVYTITYHQQQLMAFVPDLLHRALPVALNLLQSLSDEQVDELTQNMARDQEELEQEMLAGDADETARARADRTAERVERWLGDLNTDQQGLVEQWSANRGQQTEIWLQGRKNWQQALLSALEARDQTDFADAITDLVVNSEQARGPEYQAMIEESQQALTSLMHDLIQAGDQRHQEHLQARADKLNRDFVALTCS